MIIKILKKDLPKPRAPVWKIKPERIHKSEKYDSKKTRSEDKKDIRKIIKKEKPESNYW